MLAAVVAVLVIRTRNRRRAAAAREQQEQTLAELERRAGGALVTIDDEIRTAEQEVGFAAAQFGDDAAKPFADTVAIARREVRKAFALQQQLDDEVPDTAQQRVDWSNQIIATCEQAHAAIESQTEAFDQLRALEETVDTASADLTTSLTAAPAAVDAARAALERVRNAYTGRTLATVADNVDQAVEVLRYADDRAAAARTALAAGDRGAAVVAVRDGQHALAQVQQLTGAVTAAETTFADAASRAEAMRADIEGGPRRRRHPHHRWCGPGRRRGASAAGPPRRRRPARPGRRRRRTDQGEHRHRRGPRQRPHRRRAAPPRDPGPRRRAAGRPEPDRPGPPVRDRPPRRCRLDRPHPSVRGRTRARRRPRPRGDRPPSVRCRRPVQPSSTRPRPSTRRTTTWADGPVPVGARVAAAVAPSSADSSPASSSAACSAGAVAATVAAASAGGGFGGGRLRWRRRLLRRRWGAAGGGGFSGGGRF
ncbi:hypothetical protein [Curtobacterium sp. MCPF17_052]|uniref:hypothetical protein n=1 Tax=Curtobacterium sp. MCPF17_052 TaxID=2175655 RepID=UPI0024DF6536|nr:hypothetical protein [Curtobacterium sp. MCPF17_052]WIB12843.1 hypothetical protein DEJ36_01905 [Curtobacterium sp. MCPF17_052]